VAVPCVVVERNKVVMMMADIFFVDGTPFLVTLSRNIKFVTAEHLPVRTVNALVKHIERVLHVYDRSGFSIRTILMDGEFEKIKGLLCNLECNTTAAKERMSKAKQMICTIKERTIGFLATLPFEHIPWRMKIKFIYFIVLWLNAFPVKSGISPTFSLCKLLVRWKLDYKKHCRVLPGTYCEVHDKLSPLNMMTPHTHEAIALGPTGNLQGSVKFYFLDTGRVLKRHLFTPVPMPDRIIAKVNKIGAKEKQGRTFRFLNQQAQPYEWTDEVPEDNAEFQGLLEEEEAAPYPNLSTELPGGELEHEEAKLTAITKEDEPDFRALAAATLNNAGIDPDVRIRAASNYINNNAKQQGPAFVEANQDKIVYEITFDLPDAGLAPGQNTIPAGADEFVSDTHSSIKSLHHASPEQRQYPQHPYRSVVGHEPYDSYAPRIAFLQQGEIRACSSGLDAAELTQMSKEEMMHATTSSQMDLEPEVDCTQHIADPEVMTKSEDEMKVWGYLMNPVQPKARTEKIWRTGSNCSKGRVDPITHHGYMESHGSV
jgi:hypothetical protein